MAGATTMLYHYFRQVNGALAHLAPGTRFFTRTPDVGAHALTVWSVAGNVCTDWRLTHDLTTSLKTAGSGTARVNTKAFEMFLNPSFKGAEAGSCQGLGFKDKQLKFAAYVKSPSSAAASSVHAFL